MNYCSNCGRSLGNQGSPAGPSKHYRCEACGYTHYVNPRTIVACIAYWQNKILMCRRALEPAVGQWVFPSGFLECGETLQEGAARETLEETGVDIDPERLELYSVVNMTKIQQIIVAFRAPLASNPVLHPGPECLEAALKSEGEASQLELAWSGSLGNAVAVLFDEVRTGNFGIHVMTKESEQGRGFGSRAYRILSSRKSPTPPR
jgi:ADP-ribose pyrophosphatase YjhB (NUDIX family)